MRENANKQEKNSSNQNRPKCLRSCLWGGGGGGGEQSLQCWRHNFFLKYLWMQWPLRVRLYEIQIEFLLRWWWSSSITTAPAHTAKFNTKKNSNKIIFCAFQLKSQSICVYLYACVQFTRCKKKSFIIDYLVLFITTRYEIENDFSLTSDLLLQCARKWRRLLLFASHDTLVSI